MVRNQAMYLQIAGFYRDKITRGELRQGERIPPLKDIAAQWDVGTSTAQDAIKALRAERLVIPSRAHGTYVAPMRQVQGGADVIFEPTGSAPADTVEVVSAKVVDAPSHVASVLGVNPDDEGWARVSRREAVTYRAAPDGSGVPARLSVSWAPPFAFEAVPELLEPVLLNGLVAIARATGRKAVHGTDYFEARTADAREAHHLQIAPGTPVLAMASVWSDSQGPIEYREAVMPAERAVSVSYPVELEA